jgi:hypothetical protein
MAKVWFVRRHGERWIAPTARPAYEMPLSNLVFRLDLGPQRWLSDERPEPEPCEEPVDPKSLQRVIVETSPDDLTDEFTSFRVGFYDSPYSPREVMRRLGPPA